MFCGKIAVSDAHVLVLGCSRVVDLYVGRDVAITISLAEVVEVLVRDLAYVELVVARCEDVVVNSLVRRLAQSRHEYVIAECRARRWRLSAGLAEQSSTRKP